MIYLDNAATKLGNYNTFNSNSLYAEAEQNKLYEYRNKIAKCISAEPEEIYFTSGGCESNSWAIQGIANKYKSKGNHIITSCIEHPSILNCCKYLENNGFEVTYLSVDKNGSINLEELQNAIKDTTILISIMHVNNEIGTIQPIFKIGEIAREHDIIFHTDCVQSMGLLPINVMKNNADLISASGHKFGAPFGIGFLYIRKGVEIAPLIFGGSQEQGLRGGTTNLPAIKRMTHCLADSYKNVDKRIETGLIKIYLKDRLKTTFDFIKINTPDLCSSNILSVTFKGIDAEELVLFLNDMGIQVSAGSACHSGNAEPSYVLKAIGLTDEEAKSTVRFSLSNKNTYGQIDILINVLQQYFKMRGIYEQ